MRERRIVLNFFIAGCVFSKARVIVVQDHNPFPHYSTIILTIPGARVMAFTDKFDKEDYYLTPEGYIVFTEKYHLKRGYCCQSGCKHCPWKNKTDVKPKGGK